MPTFDRVASEGILFNNCFTSNPKCAPCRASITTGRNTWQLREGVQHYNPWPKGFVTYADILEENGYFVGYTGKGWGPGDYKSAGRKNNPAGKAYNKFFKKPPARYISNDDYSRNFIEYFMKERPAGKPFCFWLGFNEPHRPYEDGAGERGGKDLKSVEIPKYYPDHRIVRSDLADYAYECEHMDSHVKKVLDYLESVGELDNTLVFGLAKPTSDFYDFAMSYKAQNQRIALAQCYGLARIDSKDDSCARKISEISETYPDAFAEFAAALKF